MGVKKYYKFGMRVFEAAAKVEHSVEANRDLVADFMQRLAEGHANVVQKYGSSLALSTIFMDEVVKYYSTSLSLPSGASRGILAAHLNDIASKHDTVPHDCVIMYPSFFYRKMDTGTGVGVAHIPTVRGFVLDGDTAELVKADYASCEKEGEPMKNGAVVKIIRLVAEAVAQKWAEPYTLDPDERNTIADEVVIVLMINNTDARKSEVLNNLIEDGYSELARLLPPKRESKKKHKKEPKEEPKEEPREYVDENEEEFLPGRSERVLAYVKQLNAKYATSENIKAFKKEFMDSFSTPSAEMSPRYLEEFLWSPRDGDTIKRKLGGDFGFYGQMDWLGRSVLDLSKAALNDELRDYADIIAQKHGYFKITPPTRIRCQAGNGKPQFNVSDTPALVTKGIDINVECVVSFQTSKIMCTKEKFMECIQAHLDYCLENNLVPDVLVQKIISTTSDKWFLTAADR